MLLELLKGNITQEEYLIQNNIKIISKKLPKKIYGLVFDYLNYNFIVINYSLSDSKQKKTLLHEFAHIELKHINKKQKLMEFKIDGLEDEADEYITSILNRLEL